LDIADAVQLKDIVFGYDRNKPVLQVEEFSVSRAKRVFLFGPSGSGKTTLLGLITGILQPQRGSCMVLGQEMTKLSQTKRDLLRGAEMGYIFQGLNLIPYLTVRGNVALPCQIHGQRRKRILAGTLQQEVERLTRRLELEDELLDRGVKKLSTGQQQRVAIARAVIGQPQLVIADEPTSSLDTDRREAFLELLFEVCEEANATLIFVSHDRSLMGRFDERIALGEVSQVVV
jgi:putative ABC transport system ATP-binding protein